MKRIFIIITWIVAICSLSRVIHAGRVLGHGFSWGVLLQGLVWLVLFGTSLFLLSLRTYAVEKARGRVVRPIALFERLLEKK